MMKRFTPFLAALFSLPLLAQPGSICDQALPASPGQNYSPPLPTTWYAYTAGTDGFLLVKSCGLASCNTRIAIYGACEGLVTDAAGLNALAYNDDLCGNRSMVRMAVTGGSTYHIRISGADCEAFEADWTMLFDPACDEGSTSVRVQLQPDNWDEETSWTLNGFDGGTLASGGGLNSTAVCAEEGACLSLRVEDSFGDGIVSPGGAWLFVGTEVAGSATGDFGNVATIEGNCGPGQRCSSALPVEVGSHQAPEASTWYLFIPAENGNYAVSTCDGNTCDSRVWVYDHCQNLIWDGTNIGSIAFNDNNDDCGELAMLNAGLVGGQTYWIRIGDTDGACGDQPIAWTLAYNGPITGCMDPTSCNFNPMATVDDGSCLSQGDPDCPQAPDLLMRQDVLETTITQDVTDLSGNYLCLLNEDCVTGFGERELVRFTTRIDNIGEQDYYIGIPTDDNPQFSFDACHGHYHYVGYAEYLLFDMDGQQRAEGFKNGFCVFDLMCPAEVTGQYTCGNQGLTAGCGDAYGAGLTCQWIDITDVPDGEYKLVVRVNWDQSPDALGRIESDWTNNWGQVCITIDRTPSLQVTVADDCAPYVDCAGVQYGSAQLDCTGVCGGATLTCDNDDDNDHDYTDANWYLNTILLDVFAPNACNDANADSALTVTDMAMVANCHFLDSTVGPEFHTACEFPQLEVINIFDEVTFTLANYNPADSTVEVWMKNPERGLIGYELRFEDDFGQLLDAESLVPEEMGMGFWWSGLERVAGASFIDVAIPSGNVFIPLARLKFSPWSAMFCLSEVIDVVNEDYHNGVPIIQDGCITVTSVEQYAYTAGLSVVPNPAQGSARITGLENIGGAISLDLFDARGRIVRSYPELNMGNSMIDLEGIAPGPYVYRTTGAAIAVGSLLVH